MGSEARRRAGPRARRAALLDALRAVLEERGFEPREEGDRTLRLGNCPFHALSAQFTDLMCGMNQSMLRGVVEGLRVAGVDASLDPKPGSCCVKFTW
jgi:predicted ArsR family transcriptional regulator